MMAFALSYGFVGAILALASLLEKTRVLSGEHARKFIHVGVAHWFLIAVFTFDDALRASIVPASFILINFLSYRFKLVKAMEREEPSSGDLGTVYYALSLTIITYLSFAYDTPLVGLFAVLGMGYGDGLGAIIGKRFGAAALYHSKTLAGSLAMLGATLGVGLAIFQGQMIILMFIAMMATLVELFTPKGFDNLSVPLFIYFVAVLFL